MPSSIYYFVFLSLRALRALRGSTSRQGAGGGAELRCRRRNRLGHIDLNKLECFLKPRPPNGAPIFFAPPGPRLWRGAGAPCLAARATKPFGAFAALRRRRSSSPAPGTCGFRGPRPRPRLVSPRSFASPSGSALLCRWSCFAASEPFGFLGSSGSHLRRLPSHASEPFGLAPLQFFR